MALGKSQIAEWWSAHPQDYQGWNAPSHTDQDGLAQYLRAADDGLRRDHPELHDGDRFFARLIPYSRLIGKRVLEIGCGLGAVSQALARAGSKATALDLSSFGIRATQWRLRATRLNGCTVQADAEQLPFAPDTFDFVWAWGVLHHSPHTARAVDDIHRILAPGGSACVMVYHRQSIYAHVNILLRRGLLKFEILRHSFSELLTRYSDGREFGGCPLAQYFSKKDAQEMFRKFSRVEISVHGEGEDLIKVFPSRWRIRRIMAALFPERARQLIMRRYGHFLIIQATK